MADIDDAFRHLRAIRTQIARDTPFRGYGAETVAATGVMAAAAAALQAGTSSGPLHFMEIWTATALCAALLTGLQTFVRTRRMHSAMPAQMLASAASSFLPPVLTGAMVTAVLAVSAPRELWMLPGLWQIFYGLGIIASLRLMPRQMLAAGVWFLATGALCLAAGKGPQSLSPWEMGFPFAIGQLLIAAILRSSDGNLDERS